MEDISALIREAKPLYFARKRRRRAAVSLSAAVLFLGAAFAFSFMPQPPIGYDSWTEQLYATQNGSVIEDMGLPVDEYGLLMIG